MLPAPVSLDVGRLCSSCYYPVSDSLSNELTTAERGSTTHDEEVGQSIDYICKVQLSIDLNGYTFPTELIRTDQTS